MNISNQVIFQDSFTRIERRIPSFLSRSFFSTLPMRFFEEHSFCQHEFSEGMKGTICALHHEGDDVVFFVNFEEMY